MVAHGYRISDGYGNYFGFRSGNCFGVGYKPYELSCEANIAYLPNLKRHKTQLESRLADAREGRITELSRMETPKRQQGTDWRIKLEPVEVKYTRDEPKYEERDYTQEETIFDRLLKILILNLESDIRWTDGQIEHHTKMVTDWKLQPLWTPPAAV
jgi:hypothetical protein